MAFEAGNVKALLLKQLQIGGRLFVLIAHELHLDLQLRGKRTLLLCRWGLVGSSHHRISTMATAKYCLCCRFIQTWSLEVSILGIQPWVRVAATTGTSILHRLVNSLHLSVPAHLGGLFLRRKRHLLTLQVCINFGEDFLSRVILCPTSDKDQKSSEELACEGRGRFVGKEQSLTPLL